MSVDIAIFLFQRAREKRVEAEGKWITGMEVLYNRGHVGAVAV